MIEALFEGALFRERSRDHGQQLQLGFIDQIEPRKAVLHKEWENAREREKASRSRFAQHALHPQTVAAELSSVRAAIGSKGDVQSFVGSTLQRANVPHKGSGDQMQVEVSAETLRALRQALGRDESFAGRFDLPLCRDEIYLGRTSPVVEGLASWVLDQALDPAARDDKAIAARCGAAYTSMVSTRTVLLVARFRYHLKSGGAGASAAALRGNCPIGLHRPGRLADMAGPGGLRGPTCRAPGAQPGRHRCPAAAGPVASRNA